MQTPGHPIVVFIRHMPRPGHRKERVTKRVSPKNNGNDFFIAMQCQGNAFERNVMHMNAGLRIRALHFKRDDATAIIPDELVEKWAPVVRLYVGYLYGHDRQMRRRREGIELRLSAPEEGHPGHVLGATDRNF